MESPRPPPPDAPSRPAGSAAAEDDGERVVLVDEQDRPLGSAGKIAAHRDGGRLHRAFSVFLSDADGRILLQRRARAKYHFPLLWTNACCGHPRPGEEVVVAARRRVREELGVEVDLHPAFAFVYTARDDATGLVEREYDHVLVGRLHRDPRPAAEEVAAVRWQEPDALLRDVAASPERYTPWFRVALEELEERALLGRRAAPTPGS